MNRCRPINLIWVMPAEGRRFRHITLPCPDQGKVFYFKEER
jgi:hypothetical protein